MLKSDWNYFLAVIAQFQNLSLIINLLLTVSPFEDGSAKTVLVALSLPSTPACGQLREGPIVNVSETWKREKEAAHQIGTWKLEILSD